MITDHGAFVLFNIYGPALTSEDEEARRQRADFKLAFYKASRGRLARGGTVLSWVGLPWRRAGGPPTCRSVAGLHARRLAYAPAAPAVLPAWPVARRAAEGSPAGARDCPPRRSAHLVPCLTAFALPRPLHLQALQLRWEDYLLRGRAVVAVGDFNIAPAPLDSCDPGPEVGGLLLLFCAQWARGCPGQLPVRRREHRSATGLCLTAGSITEKA